MRSSPVVRYGLPGARTPPPGEGAAVVASETNRQRRPVRHIRRGFLQATITTMAAAGGVLAAACGAQPAAVVATPAAGSQGSPGGTSGPGSATQPAQASRSLQTARPQKPMYQMDPQHTGRSPYAGPRKATLLRTFDTGSITTPEPVGSTRDIQSSLVVGADGTIYIGTQIGNLLALRDPGSGSTLQLLWRFHPAGASSFHGTPAIGADGTIYAVFAAGSGPETKNTLYALRAPSSGTEAQPAWSVDVGAGQAGGPSGNSPTLAADGTIYTVAGGGQVSAVGPDGKVRWTAQAGPAVKVSPALGPDGTVYTTSLDGKLYAIAPPASGAKEGSVRWTFDFGEHLGPTPLVSKPVAGPPTRGQDAVGSAASPTIGPDGTIYVGANNSNFYAITPDGKLKWLFEAERELAGIWTTAALSADNSTLYFGANKGGIYAVNAADGKLRWQSPIAGSIYSSAALDSRGTLYVGGTVGHLFAIDATNGQWHFDFDTGAAVWTAPAIRADGSLATANRAGMVLLFAAA